MAKETRIVYQFYEITHDALNSTPGIGKEFLLSSMLENVSLGLKKLIHLDIKQVFLNNKESPSGFMFEITLLRTDGDM